MKSVHRNIFIGTALLFVLVGLIYIKTADAAINKIRVTNITSSSATLSWVSSGLTVGGGVVDYGTVPGVLNQSSSDDEAHTIQGLHHVLITGLSPQTLYFYTVTSDDETSVEGSFTSAAVVQPQSPYIVFGTIRKADGNIAPGAVKYVKVRNAQSEESQLLSAVADSSGIWNLNFDTLKNQALNAAFSVTGGTMVSWAEGASEGTSSILETLVSGTTPQQLDDETLPVELVSFTGAVTADNTVRIKWRTVTETNNLGFNIYRSNSKAGNYIKVNTKLIQGGGTSANHRDYYFTDDDVKFGQTYYYYIQDIDFAGKKGKSPILQITVGKDSEVKVIDKPNIIIRPKPKPVVIPADCALLQNYPNPFNPETWIPFKLARTAPVSISIYDTKGQRIRTIALGNKLVGVYVTKDNAAYWDGRDTCGDKVASGVYYYTLQAGEFRATRKMVLLK